MDSDTPIPPPDGQSRPPGGGPSSSAALAVVHWDGNAWIAECDGVREYAGPDQIEAEVAARRVLEARGGGQLLIRGVDGRQLKRLVVDATP